MTSNNYSLLQESFWINIYHNFNHGWYWLSKPGELISITTYHCNTIVNCSILVVVAHSQKHNQKHCKPYQHRRQLPPTAGPPTPLLMSEPPQRVVSMLVNNSIFPEAADKHETFLPHAAHWFSFAVYEKFKGLVAGLACTTSTAKSVEGARTFLRFLEDVDQNAPALLPVA